MRIGKPQSIGAALGLAGLLLIGLAAAGRAGILKKGPARHLRASGSVSAEENRRPGKKSSRTRVLSGRVVQTSSYCGGANPSQEILEELRKQKPYPNKTLFVRAGTVNDLAKPILQRFASDAEGNFKISLPPGDYCIVEEAKKDKPAAPDFSKENEELAKSGGGGEAYRLTSLECLKQWSGTCDKTIKVEKRNVTGMVIEFHHGCNPPCVKGGPLRR